MDRLTIPSVEYAKPMTRAKRGIVASQSSWATEAGLSVLRDGGNAIDAAIATSLALGIVEPWMSGLGGGGYMLVYSALEDKVRCIDYSMVAPKALDPADYPLTGQGPSGGLFSWPKIRDDSNIKGPFSIAMPGLVAGLGLAHARFGSKPWGSLFGPAIELADKGLPIDWYGAMNITVAASDLAEFPETRHIFLPGGMPPQPNGDGSLRYLATSRIDEKIGPDGKRLGFAVPRLRRTLEILRDEGWESFYRGSLARLMLADLAAAGARLNAEDFSDYRAREIDPLAIAYRDAMVHAAPGLSAGPALADVLKHWSGSVKPNPTGPVAADFVAHATALDAALQARLSKMGDVGESAARPACTSHFCVVDGAGNMVAMTQTLLSRFGSFVKLPSTGILMNNGIMWFDPVPGRPNSLGPGKRPLNNMCPVIVSSPRLGRVALGASGGRKILPAVAQILSCLVDFDMDLKAAFRHPRLDCSGEGRILIQPGTPDSAIPGLSRLAPVETLPLMPYPALYANPSAAQILPDKSERRGMTDLASPWSASAGLD
jgi:gamma-glutamyltranspeptidase / glutathione hydrolase